MGLKKDFSFSSEWVQLWKAAPPACAVVKNEEWYCSRYRKAASHLIAYLFY